jgi:hypothetical protein
MMVHIQNVERQNVERQNVEYQNVDNYKTSTLQKVKSQNVDTVTFTLFHLVLRNWSQKEPHHLRRVGLG